MTPIIVAWVIVPASLALLTTVYVLIGRARQNRRAA